MSEYTAYNEPRDVWLERLRKESRLDAMLDDYHRLCHKVGLSAAALQIREAYWDPPPPPVSNDTILEEATTIDVLAEMRSNVQWALNNITDQRAAAPNVTARAYQQMDVTKLTELLLKVTERIEKSTAPTDDRLEEDYRKQMGFLTKLQPIVERDVPAQCDDMIRLHWEILERRLIRAGYQVQQLEMVQ